MSGDTPRTARTLGDIAAAMSSDTPRTDEPEMPDAVEEYVASLRAELEQTKKERDEVLTGEAYVRLEAELDAARAEVEQTKKEREQYRADFDAVVEQRDAARAEVGEKNDLISGLVGDVTTLEAEAKRLRRENAVLRSRIGPGTGPVVVTDEVEQLRTALRRATVEKDELERMEEEVERLRAALREQTEKVELVIASIERGDGSETMLGVARALRRALTTQEEKTGGER